MYIVSDAHLGCGAESEKAEQELCALLDRALDEKARVVLLGDIFDFWFSYKETVPRGYMRLLGKLAALRDHGLKVDYWTGNHDMWVFDYLERKLGVTMHEEPEMMEIDGKRWLLGHGDGLNPADKEYLLLRKFFRSGVCQWLFTLLPSSLTFAIARKWSGSSRSNHKEKDPKECSAVADYCQRRSELEEIDYCVFGHTHHAEEKILGESGCKYVNTGEWGRTRTYAIYKDGELTLRRWGE